MVYKAKVLLLDIEIIPASLGLPHVTMAADKSTITCFGYMWLEDKEASCLSLLDDKKRFFKDPYDEKKLIHEMHKIVSKADIIIGHFGSKFDFPYINTKFAMHDLSNISHIKQIDTWKIAASKLKLSSNRLNNIASVFGLDNKDKMEYKDWFKVIRSDEATMKKMVAYCKQDVIVLKQVYLKLREMYPAHPTLCIAEKPDTKNPICPNCGGNHNKKNGTRMSGKQIKQMFLCNDCGTSHQGRLARESRKNP